MFTRFYIINNSKQCSLFDDYFEWTPYLYQNHFSVLGCSTRWVSTREKKLLCILYELKRNNNKGTHSCLTIRMSRPHHGRSLSTIPSVPYRSIQRTVVVFTKRHFISRIVLIRNQNRNTIKIHRNAGKFFSWDRVVRVGRLLLG